MKPSNFKTNPKVASIFSNYPDSVRDHMLNLRDLILKTAVQLELSDLEETLKWGEPSYLTKKGSTIRIDWKAKTPDRYAMYFQCTSKLIPTFKIVYKNVFEFEGNRAIVFNLSDTLPEKELKNCIESGLQYHTIKQLPLLGL